ncbi:MAG TPA: hypothetical protein VF719_08775, partial [Abditibacteriaceae bacterium]
MNIIHPVRRTKAALTLFMAAASICAPLNAQAQAPVDATLPANQTLAWGSETVTQSSPTRGQLSLNGLWRFIPAEGAAARDPQTGWGYIRVPG